MPTTEQLRSKLINKLKELFQLNQPDLDFGFYRIMHAKAEQVSSFIENDLLQVIRDAFGQADETHKEQLKQDLEKAIKTAMDFGAPDPEATPGVIAARAKYEAIKDSASSEAEIYDHLYRFFERYYDDGDFISRRYYTRETSGKAAPFAIPYNGEEVKLHWANADQYYIKTTEYFANYTVNLTEAIKGLKENKKQSVEEIDLDESSVPEGLKLHFRIVDATEGDHANVKASDATKRYFLIHKDNPVELNEKHELIINFEYRPTMDKTKQDALNKESVTMVINALKDFEPRKARKDTKTDFEGEPQNTQNNTEIDLQDTLSCDFVPFVVDNTLPCASVLDEKEIEPLNTRKDTKTDFEGEPQNTQNNTEIVLQDTLSCASVLDEKEIEPLNTRKDTKTDFEGEPQNTQNDTEIDLQDTLSCDFVPFVVDNTLPCASVLDEKEIEPLNTRKDTKTDFEGEPQNTQNNTEIDLQDTLSCDFVPFVVDNTLPCASVLDEKEIEPLNTRKDTKTDFEGEPQNTQNNTEIDLQDTLSCDFVPFVVENTLPCASVLDEKEIEPRKARKGTKSELQDEISCVFEPFVVDKFGGISHCFKYLRLESYEDTLNNLVLQSDPIRDKTMADNASLQEDYLLHYMLDVESKGSQSLLNIDAFNDPTSYTLKIKKPGSGEYIEKAVDLIETFNYLIGLRLVHLGIPQSLTAAFTRLKDSDLPQEQDTKLIINGDFKQDTDGKWWIRKVEGWVPKNPYSPNDGLKEKVLIVWRKLTGNLEEDNLILDSWFQKNRISTFDWEFDTIYVNGSNNLPNLQKEGDAWKVRLIEEEFMKRMWDSPGV